MRRAAAWAAAPHTVWTCDGLPLERMVENMYLGVVFSAVAGTTQAAFGRLQGQLFDPWDRQQFGILHECLSSALQRGMFQHSMSSAGSYACEVWGLRRLRGAATQAHEHVAQPTVHFWWQLFRICSGVVRALCAAFEHAVAREGLVLERGAVLRRPGGAAGGLAA